MKNKPYKEYKSSDIAWLGNIPKHWQILSFKNILKERNEKNNPIRTKEILSLSIDKGVTLYAEKTTNLDRFKDDFTQYKLAHKGDLVFNSMNMIVGAVGVSRYFGCVSPVYYTYHGDSNNIHTTKFYEYLFRNKTIQGVLFSLGRGLIAIDRGDGKYNTLRLKISRDDLRSMKLPFPNPDEQTAIAKFLDYKTAKIDRFIRKKKQLIKLLHEQKAGIINEVMTKGLDENVKMKPSGIEWLGDIPGHWEDFKLKSIGYLYGGLTGKSGEDFKIEDETNILPYIPFTNIANNLIINTDKLSYVKVSENEKQNIVKKNDLLFLMSSENFADIGKTALLNDHVDNLLLNSFCKGFRITDKNILPIFLNYMLSANIHRKRLSVQARGFTRINLKIGKVNDLLLFAPKDIHEQTEIVSYIIAETKKLDKVISTIDKEITLAQEYKTALIAEAVTGKIDVRDYVIPVLDEEETYEDIEEVLDMVAEDSEEIEME